MFGSGLIVYWLTTAMHAWIPPQPHATPAQEAFYDRVAQEAYAVSYDRNEAPLYRGDRGRAQTALLLLAIASYESNYVEEVQDGKRRSIDGKSWCLMQILLPGMDVMMFGDTLRYVPKGLGWGKEELTKDMNKCFRAGLHIARESFNRCHNLSAYTTGTCRDKEIYAYYRQLRAESWYEAHKAPIDDDEIMALK